jgi:hypothetical protein
MKTGVDGPEGSGYDPSVILRAFVQEQGNQKLTREAQSLVKGLGQLRIPVTLFTEKKILRRQLPLSRSTLVAGSIPAVLRAFAQIGIAEPEPNDYPSVLEPFLHRRIWVSTVRAVVDGLQQGDIPPVFVKPKGRLKRFTGRVVSSRDDVPWLSGASGAMPVYCSVPVEWKSEFRVYVLKRRVLDCLHYSGDPAVRPSEEVVRKAVRILEDAGQAPAGYGIDFGVLADGRTALVELNDGFGLGSYGLEDELYTDLILSRWEELTEMAP